MSTDLFGVDHSKPKHEARPERHTFFAPLEAARRKLGVGKGWDWVHVDGRQHETRGILVEGAVRNADGGFRRSPRTKVIVSNTECAFEVFEYERTTGKCAECSGYGDRVRGYNAESGARYETCPKCAGSGKSS